MKYRKKAIEIAIILLIVSSPFLTIFAGYFFVGFLDWISKDPLELISDTESMIYVEDKDVIACREAGGLPKTSGWDGRLKECMSKPTK